MSSVNPESSSLTVELLTAAATRRFGALLGRLARPGDILGLDGPLGAGKTCLVQGLAASLGVRGAVTSPTFTLVNEYALPQSGPRAGKDVGPDRLFHVDLYRLSGPEELEELGLWEAAESGGVMAVEWLSRFPDALPRDRLDLCLSPMARGRSLSVIAGGERSRGRLSELALRLARGGSFS
jgi:tRNA threonylcarbamoyladenosine biosynthesis protein TsaE